MTSPLLTQDLRKRLLLNGELMAEAQRSGKGEPDFIPVVKLFNPCGAATWLLTELDPDDPDIAFGLCDLGFGCPELGSVRISELEAVHGPLGIGIERDRHFKAFKTLSDYADEAREAGQIVA